MKNMSRLYERIETWAINLVASIRPEIKYASLWLTFVLLMIVYPFVKGIFGAVTISILFSLMLFFSVATVTGRKEVNRIIFILLLFSVITRWLTFLVDSPYIFAISYGFSSMTQAIVALLIFTSLFKVREVTTGTLWGAVSAYLLLGLAWASVFAFVETVAPGSFRDSIFPDLAINYQTLIYYSFVTLATLGYGDILPTTQETRGLAIVEVLMGVLYMAILISRLVGAWKPAEKKG